MFLRIFALFFVIPAVILTSCSKNEPGVDQSEDKDEEIIASAYLGYTETVMKLYGINPEDEMQSGSASPISGMPLDISSPDTYTVGVDSFDAACEWFLTYCVPEEEKENFLNVREVEFKADFGEYGYIIWRPGKSAVSYARAEVRFHAIGAAHDFEIIPKAMLPENDNSIFYRGNIVQDTDDNQYYLVVRACEGDYGILLSFSSKWNKDEYNFKNYNDWWKGDFKLPVGPSEAAWKAYAQMYWENIDNFKGLMNDIRDRVRGVEFFGAPAVFTLLGTSNDSYRYAVGEPWGGRHLWWARKVWRLTQRYVYIGRNELKQPNHWTLPSFRMEDYNDVDHAYWSYPGFYPGVHEERFLNSQYYIDRFVLVYDGSI